MRFFSYKSNIRFMRQRRMFGVLSALAVVASLVLILVWPTAPLGTDFRGGTELEIAFTKPVTVAQLRKVVADAGFSSPDVVRVTDSPKPHHFMVRVQDTSEIGEAKQAELTKALCGTKDASCEPGRRAEEIKFSPGGDKITIRFVESPDLAWVAERVESVQGIDVRPGENNPSLQNAREHRVEVQLKSKGDQLMDALRSSLGADTVPATALRVEWIGPKAGAQLRDAALKSIAIALVFVMAYIAFRFDLRFAPGAVLALAHDALLTVGVLVVLQKELTLSTVAAVLTIVGYSVNDTVVVYDRVRENLRKLRGHGFLEIIDQSLTEMLSRTLLTSGTTIFSLLAFFIWGTATLKDFSLTLIIGLVLGTYSSIYIALPLTWWLDSRFFSRVGGKESIGNRKKRSEAASTGQGAESKPDAAPAR